VIGNAGLIVPEGDAAALTRALARLRDETELRRELGRRGRQRMLDRFTQQQVAEQTVAFYRGIMGSAASS
jgi:glycosyltransferase involved in cell wall biosynthesis